MNKAGPHGGTLCTLMIGPFRVEPTALTIAGPAGTVTLEPKVMDVLLVLAARRGEVVLRQELIEAVWAVEHGGDESLTRAISILRKALGDVHGQRTLIETVPRRGYRLLLEPQPAAPVPLAVPDAPSPALPPQKRLLHRIWPLAAGSTLALAFLMGSTAWMSGEKNVLEPLPGVVSVGEFTIAGDDPSLRDIADALPIAVSTGLSGNGLRPMAESAEARPDAQYRLTGSISRRGSAVRADLHLTDPASVYVVWSLGMVAHEEKAVRLPEFTAVKAAQMLRCLHDLRTQIPVRNTEGLILLREICENARSKSLETSSAIRALYVNDPSLPGAKGLSAFAMAAAGSSEGGEAENPAARQLREESQRLAEEVLSEDPHNLFASLAMAALEAHNGDWLAEEAWLLRAARQADARNLVTSDMVAFLRRTGRVEEASFGLRDTLRSHPSSSVWRTRRGWLEASMGNLAEARREFDIVERGDPGFEELAQRTDQFALFHEEPAIALEKKRAAIAAAGRPPDNRERCQIAFLEEKLASEPDVARVDSVCVRTQIDWRIRMFTQLGDLDRAFAEVRSFRRGRSYHEIVFFYPDMAPFRNDARFWPLVADMGLVNYWRETNRWPDFCREPDLPQPCRVGADLALRAHASNL